MRPALNRTSILPTLVAALALGVPGCGEDEATSVDEPVAAPDASAFPSPDGQSLDDLLAKATPDDEIVVLPAGAVLDEGRNRFGFGVFTVDGEQIPDAEIAIYAAAEPDGAVQGPFPARVESLETEPAFTAETTSGDPDAAKTVYVTDLIIDKPGEWRMVAMVKRGGETVAVRIPSVVVGEHDGIPAPGDEAPEIHTPTVDDVGDVQEIDTRAPPGTMHDVDFADVRGERPVVLLFATPALCASRVCGPVVDVAEQVKRDTSDEVAFIHMEIYEQNTPPSLRPQVDAFNLPTEPWLFVVDCDGEIDTRIEGAFSAAELTDAIDRVDDSCAAA